VGELIAFLSGKGGTGKTSLCAGISSALAKAGESVLCIDCDVGLRNLDIALAMTDCGALSFREIYSGGYQLSQAATHPKLPNLRFLTAPIHCTADTIDSEAFGTLLRRARQQFRYIFLDAPAGVEAGFRLAATYADRVIVVTVTDPASIRDAAHTAQLLERMGKTDVRLVVNRIQEKLYTAGKFTVDDVMDRTGIPLLGIVPEDPDVVLAAAFEKPLLLYTKTGASAACSRIAKRIQGYHIPVSIK
jgi:septum site-determining protein MinD